MSKESYQKEFTKVAEARGYNANELAQYALALNEKQAAFWSSLGKATSRFGQLLAGGSGKILKGYNRAQQNMTRGAVAARNGLAGLKLNELFSQKGTDAARNLAGIYRKKLNFLLRNLNGGTANGISPAVSDELRKVWAARLAATGGTVLGAKNLLKDDKNMPYRKPVHPAAVIKPPKQKD